MGKKTKSNHDTDYVDFGDEQPNQKKSRTSRKSTSEASNLKKKNPIAKPMGKDEVRTFMANNHDLIQREHSKGTTPETLAQMLSVIAKRPGAITNRQVSNYIYQKKKAGQFQTNSVSAKNANLRPNSKPGGWQSDLEAIASRGDQNLSDDEEGEEDFDAEEVEEHRHYELVHKFLRFFTHSDQDYFYLFLECGVKRNYTVRPVFEYSQLELTIHIPIPEDDLFHFVGIKHATEVDIEDTEELIYIIPPRNLKAKKEQELFYPNKKTPLYVVFKYEMEVPQVVEDVEEIKVDVDLTSLFDNVQES
jgi:hypothetical protein